MTSGGTAFVEAALTESARQRTEKNWNNRIICKSVYGCLFVAFDYGAGGVRVPALNALRSFKVSALLLTMLSSNLSSPLSIVP